MTATRHTNSDTRANLAAILLLVNDPDCLELRLYASPTKGSDSDAIENGPDTNYPLLSALAKLKPQGGQDVYKVFDGNFLSAARKERYNEVKDLLDACQGNAKVQFCEKRAPFTAALPPTQAADTLRQLTPMKPLTTATRAEYFSLLSNLTEAQFATL